MTIIEKNMKNIIQIVYMAMLILSLVSCRSSQEITFRGVPGTEIYTPDMEKIGVIQNDGSAKIKIDITHHCPYLMSKQSGSQKFVPFALDYKKTNYTLRECWSLIPPFWFAAIGLPQIVSNQWEYSYKYLSTQSTNEDISFAPIIDNGEKKILHFYDNSGYVSDAREIENEGTTVVKRNSSVARRKSIDFVQAVSGTYIGSGSLLLKGKTVESYSSIKVVIDRKAENKVNVRVIESGESFFGSDLEYSVKRTDDGYELILTGISNAVILIDHDGKLSFNHPKVNIDGELYTLSISAGK